MAGPFTLWQPAAAAQIEVLQWPAIGRMPFILTASSNWSPRSCEPVRIAVDVAPRHHANHEAVHLQPVKQMAEYGQIASLGDPPPDSLPPVHHGRQRATPSWGNETQLSCVARCASGSRECVACRMPGNDHCERIGGYVDKHVLQEGLISGGTPRDLRPGLIAEIVYVRNIAQALARLDPANAADYKARAAAYIKELQALDTWMRTEMMAVPAAKRCRRPVAAARRSDAERPYQPSGRARRRYLVDACPIARCPAKSASSCRPSIWSGKIASTSIPRCGLIDAPRCSHQPPPCSAGASRKIQ